MADWILQVIGLSPRDVSLISDSDSFHSAESPRTPPKLLRCTNLEPSQLNADLSQNPEDPSRPGTPPPQSSAAYFGASPSTPRHATPKAGPVALSPDEIVIPTIFLTQGARNSRLLKQGEEIARQLGADEARAARERRRLEEKRRAVLEELNSNGSAFVYSMKTDAALVDSYVEKEFSRHDSVRAARHFYYFVDVAPATNDRVPALEMFFACAASRAALHRVLVRQRISAAQLVRHALTQEFDESVLEMVSEVVELMDIEPCALAAVAEWPLDRAIRALGADLKEQPLVLKYVHYNTNCGALVRRLAIVLLYHARRLEPTLLTPFVSIFIRTALDFALNKFERAPLVDTMGRVFRALAARMRALQFSPRALLEPFHGFFARTACVVFGENTAVPQKIHELHYTFIRNLVASGAEPDLVLMLAAAFLAPDVSLSDSSEEPPAVVSAPLLAAVAADIARPGLAHSPARIFDGLYRAQLAAFFVPLVLAGALARGLSTAEKAPWRTLHSNVLDAKDSLQQAVGALQYMPQEETPEKVALSKALGETYVAFDHMSVVLDKNAAFFRSDLFYDV